jgi:hypothetical protein
VKIKHAVEADRTEVMGQGDSRERGSTQSVGSVDIGMALEQGGERFIQYEVDLGIR